MTLAGSRAAPAEPARGPATLLLAVTLLLTALNLRAAVTSIGAVLRPIQIDIGMSDTVAGLLTTLPAVCFGVIGLLAARIGRRLGTDRALVVALALITVGLAVRAMAPSVGWLLATSLMALTGMAIGNVLVPVTVKAWFPDEVGRYTGLYSLGIVVGTAVPVAVTFPLAEAFGNWRYGLGIWAIPAGLALIPWLFVGRQARAFPPPLPVPGPSPDTRRMWRAPKAWALLVFFGIQSLEAYVAMGWLPTILQDAGVPPANAGLLAALTMVLAVPIAIGIPMVASRRPDQRPWVVILSAASFAAYLGLLFAPASAPLLWAVLLGIGLGAFPLALLLIGLRAVSPGATSELSSFVQGGGYLLAATGPILIGALHDLTGGWELPLGAMVLVIVPKLISGLIAGAPGVIDIELRER